MCLPCSFVAFRLARLTLPALSTLRLFRLLLWVHWRSLLARVRGLRRARRCCRLLLVGFVLGYLLLGYFLFHQGLDFLFAFPAVGALLAHRILFLIFGFFFVMLMFSNLIIGYSTLFKNRETNWFLTLPIRHADIYRWKFLECLVVSSWALMFLSAPMMVAFGRVQEVGAAFYFEIALIYLPFVAIPAVLGSALVLLIVALLSKPWAKKAVVIAVGSWRIALVAAFRAPGQRRRVSTTCRRSASSTSSCAIPVSVSIPSCPVRGWRKRCFHGAAGWGARADSSFACCLSNALLGCPAGFRGGEPVFLRQLDARVQPSFRAQPAWPDARRQRAPAPGVSWNGPRASPPVAALVSRPVSALVLKDTRVFWRDPAQWTQVMIFFGLLTIYVLNLRNVAYDLQSPFWSTMISYLNLTACALTLSTLTTRFVFPQFSLEGRRLWIHRARAAGTGPRVLMQKFWSSCLAATAMTVGADDRLQRDPQTRAGPRSLISPRPSH